MEINNLFPTPVAFFKLDRALDAKEENFLLNQKMRPNEGNVTSVDTFLLRNKTLTNLRQFIEDSISEYFAATYNPKGNVQLRITQSWVNFTEQGQYHHKHEHSNSFVSGVFYVRTNDDSDKIHFYKEEYQQIKIPAKDWNIYNSRSWWFSVKAGDLVLFPSSLTHMVAPVTGDKTRVSLAFNTFLVGNIGEDVQLTSLHINDNLVR